MAGYTQVTMEFKKITGLTYFALILIALYIDLHIQHTTHVSIAYMFLVVAVMLIAEIAERLQHNADVRALLMAGQIKTRKVVDDDAK